MSTTFATSARLFITSESVTEGHPDKMCDQISDSILDAILAQDPEARVACETATTTGLVLVAGEITTTATIDVTAIVRETIRRIGYTDPSCGFDADSCGVVVSLGKQSPDIALGVGRSFEARGGASGDDAVTRTGAGDQGMMFGFACDETPELMPLSISLAHGLAKGLATARRSGEFGYLRPDGKAQVTLEYAFGKPRRVDAIVISTQHHPDVTPERLARRCEVQVSYAIGIARPLAISIETFGTATVPEDWILATVEKVFDLRPGAIIRDLRLRRPIYAATAAYGHFGRLDIDAPWEETNKVDELQKTIARDAAGAAS